MAISIAIVGSGVSAIGALQGIHEHITKSDEAVNITIFEETDNMFNGFAYNPRHTQFEHLLNANTQAMEIGGKDAFKDWLADNELDCIKKIKEQRISTKLKTQLIQSIKDLLSGKPDIYIPRVIYGLFLQDLAGSIIKELEEKGCTVTKKPNSKVKSVKESNASDAPSNTSTDEQNRVIKIELNGDETFFFDRTIITAGNTVDISQDMPNFLYSPHIKDKINKLILSSVKDGKKSINIVINHATLAGLDAQRTVNECVQFLREKGEIPPDFKIHTYIKSNYIAQVPRPNSNLLLPNYTNRLLTLEHFKSFEKEPDFNPMKIYSQLLQEEMKVALPWVDKAMMVSRYRRQLQQSTRTVLSGPDFLNQNSEFFGPPNKNLTDAIISYYQRKIILNSTLLIYHIFSEYKQQVDLQEWEKFFVKNLALSPSSVIRDTLSDDPNIEKTIISEVAWERLKAGLTVDLPIDTWTRDPKFEQPLFGDLPKDISDILKIVKLETALANNGYMAYKKGFDAGKAIGTSSNPALTDGNSERLDTQKHFT